MSGSPGNDTDAKRIREFVSDINDQEGTADARTKWPRCLEPAWPVDAKDDHSHYGIVSFERKSGNDAGKYILDCSVGIQGAFEGEELPPPIEKDASPQILEMHENWFRELLAGKKYFPLRILQYALDALDKLGTCSAEVSGDTCVGYIIGKKISRKREVVRHFNIPIGELKELRPEAGKERQTLRQLIDRLHREFQGGKMTPAPFGRNARMPDDEGKTVCGACHLRTACRYHFAGDPLRCGTRDEE